MQAVSHSTDADVPVELDAELAGVVVNADKRRIVRVIANLLDNASQVRRRRHERVAAAGRRRGADRRRGRRGGRARRRTGSVIFDRFSRGSAGGRRGSDRRRRARPGAGRRAREPPRRDGVGRGSQRRRARSALRGPAPGRGAPVRAGRRLGVGLVGLAVVAIGACGLAADDEPQAISTAGPAARPHRPEPRPDEHHARRVTDHDRGAGLLPGARRRRGAAAWRCQREVPASDEPSDRLAALFAPPTEAEADEGITSVDPVRPVLLDASQIDSETKELVGRTCRATLDHRGRRAGQGLRPDRLDGHRPRRRQPGAVLRGRRADPGARRRGRRAGGGGDPGRLPRRSAARAVTITRRTPAPRRRARGRPA